LGMAGCNSGSCDSMVSTASNHSQRSDNSYDYLSVEEKECLMFLEETIGSLDAEADSGVSTDDTDYVEPSRLPGTWRRRGSSTLGRQAGNLPSSSWEEKLCPSLVQAGCWRQLVWVALGGAAGSQVPQAGAARSKGSRAAGQVVSARDLANGASPPGAGQCPAAEKKGGKSISAFSSPAPAAAPSPGYYSLPRGVTVGNGASESKASAPPAEDPAPGDKSPQETAKPLGSLMIHPPDPFDDDSVSHEWLRSPRSDAKREAAKETKAWSSWGHPEKATSEEAPQDPEAKRGPPTAPKPRKLPPNIILKTSKNSPVPLGSEPGQKAKAPPPPPVATSPPGWASDTTTAAEKANPGHHDPKDRERARREALEKLGLSQDRRVPGSHLQPITNPQPQEVPSPVPGEPGGGCGVAAAPGARQMPFKSNTLERSGVGLSSYVASAKEQNVKTSSSLGKMSFLERLAPSFLRSGRPRPVSLVAGKDFAGPKEPGQAEQEKSSKRRSHPLQSFPRPARSCVSVKISPKGSTEENRREALRKLGLLKD
ncbi:SARG protein, partial [Rhinopomastus cyanomelas]|nr:SARG protein [Rhinopomastus cyanomelas]